MKKRKRFDAVARASAIAVFEDELKTRSDGYVEHLAHGGKADCGEEFYLDALYMAIAALREQPRWISVEERLPDKDTLVLCIGKKGGMFLGFIRNYHEIQGGAYTYVPNARGARYATHWMPLPEPPEVKV